MSALRFYPGPLIALGIAAYVYWYNQTADNVLRLVFLDQFVGPDPHVQGRVTWQLIGGFGLLYLAYAVYAHVRLARQSDEE